VTIGEILFIFKKKRKEKKKKKVHNKQTAVINYYIQFIFGLGLLCVM
jgi:hypothetical protein